MRSTAAEEILRIFESNTHSLEPLYPYLDDFVKLLLKLMNDSNFKITINSLNIAGFLVNYADKNKLGPYIQDIIQALLQKLGDSKIAVRQIASQILSVAAKV